MQHVGDRGARIVLPLEGGLGGVAVGPVRSYLRLHRLPKAVSEFILKRVEKAVSRLAGRGSPRSARVRLTLRIRDGQLHVVLRFLSAGPWNLRLAPLTRGAPPGVKAVYREGRRGGTLTFKSALKREA